MIRSLFESRPVLTTLLAAVLAYIVLQTAWTGWNILRSRSLEPVAVGSRAIGSGGPVLSMFVTGDSAGAGLGATSWQTSFVGRVALSLATGRHVEVRNTSVSGAKMADLSAHSLPENPVDLVLLSAGSNDLFHLTGAEDLERSAVEVLERYGEVARQVAVIGPGMIHGAPADPLVLRLVHWLRRPAYVEALRRAAAEAGATYVDPCGDMDSLTDQQIEDTVSDVDNFHLSDAGHAWWAQRILTELSRHGFADVEG
ncbi:MAG: hypothetical protein DWQ36_16565 [Acidobacteria bacterium]|nr:MAG: hypothetical protein DWQ30_14735 [Acidobacteriota bacterium]REK04467.1 MAG: hypothetical protein DWQ36_16565 [Acidobacteriota bacterium]